MDSLLHDFIAIDIETTGLNPDKDAIIELAACEFQDCKIKRTFSTLVNPNRSLPEAITIITGITDDDLLEAPTIDSVWNDFLQFSNNQSCIFHNAPFDLSFLKKTGLRQGILFNSSIIMDTLILARAANPFLNSYKLCDLITEMKVPPIPESFHRAGADALQTGMLYISINQFLMTQSLEILNDLANFFRNSESFYQTYFRLILKQYQTQSQSQRKITPSHSYNQIFKTGEDFTKPDHIYEIFRPNGLISNQLPDYEFRQLQEDLSEFIYSAFNEDAFAMAEAGTGTGKSFAYLIPAILFAHSNKKTVYIATRTKSLQDQLFFKDIPFLHDLFGNSFRAALLKGKSNYACLKKVDFLKEYHLLRFTSEQREQLLPLISFLYWTHTGDISEIYRADPVNAISRAIGAEQQNCFPTSCPYRQKCYWFKIRMLSPQSQIVILNHSLLLADLQHQNAEETPYQYVIIDEAHQLEKNAASYFGESHSLEELTDFFTYYCLPSRQKATLITGLIESVRKKGMLSPHKIADMEKLQKQLENGAKKYMDNITLLFDHLRHYIRQRPTLNDFSNNSIRLKETLMDISSIDATFKMMSKTDTEFKQTNRKLSELIDEEQGFEDALNQILAFTQNLQRWTDFIQTFLTNGGDNIVHWFETNQNQTFFKIHSWPIEVSSFLQKNFYNSARSVIMLSATLTINHNFIYYKRRLGLENYEKTEIRELILDSPFEMEQQIALFVPTFLPETDKKDFQSAAAELMASLIKQEKRSALILFTSYQMLRNFDTILHDRLAGTGITLMKQARGSSNKQLIQDFKNQVGSVLLGTDTFWEGIDVPGKALEIVTIAKLPFMVPNDPMVEARIELLEAEDKRAFYHYTLPEAIIRLKQGIGRLIRHRNDYGIIIILDKRLVTSSYSQVILQSLPVKVQPIPSLQLLRQKIGDFFTLKENPPDS